jgi:uncharacterized protein (TIGR03067 family)
MHRPLLLLAIVLSLAFAPAPFPRRQRERGRDHPKRIMGEWQGGHRLLIRPGRLTYNPGTQPAAYALTLDTNRWPAAYDLAHPGTATPRWLGIFKVEGDTLTLCYRSAEQGRPAAFGSPGAITEVYKRLKP